jgi:hypothetical protein
LPTIIVSNRQLRDISADSLDALRAANDPPQLFARSNSMVAVIRVAPAKGSSETTGD